MLEYLKVNDTILEEKSSRATKVLMQLAIFLVLYYVSNSNSEDIELRLEALNSIIITGGVSKVLRDVDIEEVVQFFYKKILHSIQPQRL